MIIVGAILLVLGFVFHAAHWLTMLGIILLVVGAALWIMGSTGHPVGGRRYWY